jgi:hypothetical protein
VSSFSTSGGRSMAAAKPEPAASPIPSPATPATPAPPAPSAGQSISLPSFSSDSIPGGTAAEKALLVAGILVLGLALWSRITGTSFNLGLTGFSGLGVTAKASAPPPTVASQAIPATTAKRMAVVNPAKASA